MDVPIALSHATGFLLVALALALANLPLRRLAIAWLVVSAGLTLFAGLTDDGTDGVRTLETVHHYAGYEGVNLDVGMVPFRTHTHTADAGLWPLPWAAFAAFWIVVLWSLRGRALKSAWILPLLLAWSATATWLSMQFLAAPAAVVQPIGLDRFLWPAGLALALVAARRCGGAQQLALTVGGGIMLARLPAALFSSYASAEHIGTSLDIHLVRDIVNPMTRMQFEPRLEIGSGQQAFYLIWLEHLIIFPALYLMSLFGVAFGVFMFHKHGPAPAPRPTS